MKQLFTLACVLCCSVFAAQAYHPTTGDTVIIEIDKNTRILIYTKSKADIKALEQYDINKMIRDLNASITDSSKPYIELKNDGDSYLKDTTIIYQESERSRRTEISRIELRKERDDEWYDQKERKSDYQRMRSRRTDNEFIIDLGKNNWLENGNQFPNELNRPYSVKPWGSWYVGLNSINKTYIAGPLFLDWGFGVNWFNWRFEDANQTLVKTPTEAQFTTIDPTFIAKRSRLTAAYLNYQMVPMFHFGDMDRKYRKIGKSDYNFVKSSDSGFRVGVGGYVGYRLTSYTKLRYIENGREQKDRVNDNFYMNNIRYGIRGQIGWRGVDFFCTYDLNEVFVEGNGPRLNAVSFGIML